MSETVLFLNELFGSADPARRVLLWTFPAKKSTWLAPDRLADAERIVNRNLLEQNWYVGVALSPEDYGPNKRCTAANTVGISALWADIDCADAAHQKPNLPPTRTDSETLVKEMGLVPTVTIHTGHGLQAWWMFKEVWDWFGDGAELHKAASLAKRWQGTLAARAKKHGWSVDSTHDLARVLRLPGTLNLKENLPAADVTVLEKDYTRRYEPGDFEGYLIEEEGTFSSRPAAVSVNGNGQASKAAGLVLNSDPPFRMKKYLDLCEIEPKFKASFERKRRDMQDNSPSSQDMALAHYAASAGWTDQEIADLIISCRLKNGEDLKIRKNDSYYSTTIGKARQSVQKDEELREFVAIAEERKEQEAAGIEIPIEEQKRFRETALEKLAGLLGFKIDRIVKYECDDPTYRIFIGDKSVEVGGPDVILSFQRFAVKMAGFRNRNDLDQKKLKKSWHGVADVMLRIAEEVELGTDTVAAAAGKNWVSDYLMSNTIMDTKEKEIVTRCPFRHDGGTYLFEESLRNWLLVERGQRLSPKMLGIRLREAGLSPRVLSFKINGRKTTRYVWKVPENISDDLAE